MCQSLFFIKKETLAQVFSCEFCEISKSTFFTEHAWTTASEKNVLFGIKLSPPYPPAFRFFKNFIILSQAKYFLKVFMCYVLAVYKKRMVIFFISVYFAFLSCFAFIKSVFNFLQFYGALWLVFNHLSKNLTILVLCIPIFWWYRIDGLLQFPQSLKFKPNSSTFTYYPNTSATWDSREGF